MRQLMASKESRLTLKTRLNQRFLIRHRLLVLQSMFAPSVGEMRRFKGIGRGQRCFILGNGPSLKRMDPIPLRREATFGVNAIYLARDWLGFLPTYHVTEDPLVIADRGREISEMTGPVKFYHRHFRSQIPPNGAVVHPRIFHDYSDYPDFPRFSRDASRCLWTGGSVSYLCLQLAFYMEYSPVILVGFDHHYERPENTVVRGTVWTSPGDDPNHFDPDYFGHGRRWYPPDMGRIEQAFARARQVYTQHHRRLLNATDGGRLDVLTRVSYRSLFDQPAASA